MGRGQADGDLAADPEDLGKLQRTAAVQPVLERLAGDERHDEVGKAPELVDGIDRHDVFVADRRGRPRLAGEPPPGRGHGRQLRRHHLDGHQPVQGRVVRLEHDPHAPLADDLDHLVLRHGAEQARPRRRAQEVERELPAGLDVAGDLSRHVRAAFVELRHQVAHDRAIVARDRPAGLGELARHDGERTIAAGQPLQGGLADPAVVQVPHDGSLVRLGQDPLDQGPEPIRRRAFEHGCHGRAPWVLIPRAVPRARP